MFPVVESWPAVSIYAFQLARMPTRRFVFFSTLLSSRLVRRLGKRWQKVVLTGDCHGLTSMSKHATY